jgi:16S rRNA (guanine527-N7)-methyltransferase
MDAGSQPNRMSSREFRDRLRRRAKRAFVDLTPELAEALERYFTLLTRWNAKINLTSFKLEPNGDDEAIDRLLIEPVVAARHVAPLALTAIDIGSGGGSPALPLSLACPRLSLRMVESKTRKAVFLREAIRELELPRVTVETSRFEELLTRPELHEGLDLVTIRAVRVEPRTLVSLQAFLKPGGHLFLFRGPGGADVAESLTPALTWLATYPLVDALRSRLVVLQKTAIGRRF